MQTKSYQTAVTIAAAATLSVAVLHGVESSDVSNIVKGTDATKKQLLELVTARLYSKVTQQPAA